MKKIKADESLKFERVLLIETKYMDAEYYNDGSGEVFIHTGTDHEMIFDDTHGNIASHIRNITKRIKELKRYVNIAEKGLLTLKNAKVKAKL